MNTLSLKWGTLKAWNFQNCPKFLELAKEYDDIGASFGAMMQKDTDRQKEIICEIIDLVDDPKGVYLDWDGKYVSKKDAKKYVMEYPR